jgi:2',3'-cyclic-nucleotide 2'-phosphodiesterase (5'-nucleotidase family)
MEESVMSKNNTRRSLTVLVTLTILFSLFSSALGAPYSVPPAIPVTFTILHTNDFHGQLQAANADPNKISTPGMARTARVVNAIRTAKGAANVLLVDAGDEMQGSLLSNLGDGTASGKGAPTIATFNQMAYDVATFGNHEFDWGQTVLGLRTTQATYPFVTANIVKMDGADCASSGWTKPDFAAAPYVIKTLGTTPNQLKVAFIGVTTLETPTITIASATAGLCFKDPTVSIEHYYNQMKTDGADVIVVLSHLGYADGGYGYGIPVYGDQTLAKNLITNGNPVNLIIGGHSHTSVAAPGTTVTVTGKTGSTLVVQSAYNGRRVGQADITVGTDGSVTINWIVTVWTQQNLTAIPAIPASVWRTFTSSSAFTEDINVSEDVGVAGVINTFANDANYLALVNTPVGYSAVDLGRNAGTTDNMMGTFVDDAIYNYLNTDGITANDIDIFFNNAGGIRTDWCYVAGVWQTSGCTTSGLHDPGLLTYGNMFTILPFGNATVVGKMTGAQILDVLNHAGEIANSSSSPAGAVQPAGLKYTYYAYRDANPGPQPYAWGAYDATVYDKVSASWVPLDLKKTYSVGTNEFLAPAGGDNFYGFKYMTNITYWGDMLNAVNAYVAATYGTAETAYKGPNGDGTLDARIKLNGDGDTTYDVGEIVPLTILHHNDSHGNLAKGTYLGYTQLATLIKQERLHNPDRTLLLNAGDSFQGDAMMYYFKDAGAGIASDGTILPPTMQINPLIALMNSMNYTAMTLGNHEFNFGSKVFVDTFTQASFPILGANVTDSGLYGINKVVGSAASSGTAVVNVRDSISLDLPSGGTNPLKVAILGITNHRVPNYELPSNIPGLTFSDPIAKAAELVPGLRATNDVVIALTHIGFTDAPGNVEIDANVDTNLAATVNGIDAIIGGHSHTNPATGYGSYKYLPSIVAAPNGKADIINQAYRWNNTLGEVVIGLRANGSGGYDVVSQTGRYLSVVLASTAEDAATKAIVDPYVTALAAYNTKVIGSTTAPIDALQAYTQETNGANLQADAAMYELQSHGITPDFHLSGAMTNSKIATGATVESPVSLTIANMFTAMPYENSLVVISMNGPQIKAVLERGYRNYYYYKYYSDPWNGYSHYTTCMLDTNSGNKITYLDTNPRLPNGNNVLSLTIGGVPVDFNNASKYYNVSTVNYLAAGSCNFNNSGATLWPLNQIVADTQYYVRDAVIDYITHEGTISPAIEGRLDFLSLIFRQFLPWISKN